MRFQNTKNHYELQEAILDFRLQTLDFVENSIIRRGSNIK